MPPLIVTREQLETATATVYADSAHAPTNIWIDHFGDDWSYIRATYPSEFCGACAKRLMWLRSLVSELSGNGPNVTVCIYMGDTAEQLAEDRQRFVRNRLSGIRPPRP